MAKKSSKKSARRSKVVATRAQTGTSLVSYREKLAALAAQEAERAVAIGGGANTIRLRKGKFLFRGEDLGEELDFVCVDFVKTRHYFDEPFDEDNPAPPVCFSLASHADSKMMRPHETSPKPQSDACRDCWANEFETDGRGRGKACREQYLLAIVHPDSLEKDELDIEDVSLLRVPPTSLAAWDSAMVKRNKVFNLPALAFKMRATFDEDVDYQKLEFEEIGRCDEEEIGKLLAIHESVRDILMTPPDVTPRDNKDKRKKKKKASKKQGRDRR